jgi:hypothetical protein
LFLLKVSGIIKGWLSKYWLHPVGFGITFSFIVLWLWYRSSGGLITRKYKGFSSYVLLSRPLNYFNNFRGGLNRFRIFEFSKSLSSNEPVNLPYIGSAANNNLNDMHERFFRRMFEIFGPVDDFSIYRLTDSFRLLFLNFSSTWSKGVYDVRYKFRETKALYKQFKLRKRNIKK